MKPIAITGFKRSGKGETGKAILSVAQDYSVHAVTLGFADKLKVAACRNLGMLDWTDESCINYMDYFKEYGTIDFQLGSTGRTQITGRQYLQWMGTEYRKLFGEDFWINQVLPTPNWRNPGDNRMAMDHRYPGAQLVAFTDCRFTNEAKRCLDLGGEVWEITHPNTESDGHASEQRFPRELVTRTIVNDGTLMDLRYNVERALRL